jgi:tektin-1
MANAVQTLPKCLPAEWHASHHVNISNAKREEAAAERLRDECERLRRETDNTTARVQETNMHKFSQRIRDIAFWRQELEKKLTENVDETNLLLAKKKNLEEALIGTEFPLEVANLCLQFRTQREQVDLVHDAVEVQLIKVF